MQEEVKKNGVFNIIPDERQGRRIRPSACGEVGWSESCGAAGEMSALFCRKNARITAVLDTTMAVANTKFEEFNIDDISKKKKRKTEPNQEMKTISFSSCGFENLPKLFFLRDREKRGWKWSEIWLEFCFESGRVELLIDFWRRKWKRKKKTAKTEVLRLREKKGWKWKKEKKKDNDLIMSISRGFPILGMNLIYHNSTLQIIFIFIFILILFPNFIIFCFFLWLFMLFSWYSQIMV